MCIRDSGNSFDFGLVFNDWNTSTTLLYDPDDTENAAYAFIKATYADATVDGFLTLPDYFSTKGIDYVSAALVAVSYTHLRAHETGRNLVCRLLLEKKKKNNKNKQPRHKQHENTKLLNNKKDQRQRESKTRHTNKNHDE